MSDELEDRLRARAEEIAPHLNITRVEVKTNQGFTVQHVEEELKSGDIVNALILSSTLLEIVFSRLLQRRFEITEEQFDELWNRSSLGRYWQICRVTEALPRPAPDEDIERLIRFRNKLVHEASYLGDLESDVDERSEIETHIRNVMRYVDSIELPDQLP